MSAILNAVYNNYLTTYAPKSLTRYDTHKKSELRSVYNSIVRINKEAPWYLPTTNKETQHYAVDMKENARELHNTIAQVGGLEEKGLLNKKRAYSSNEYIVTATYVGPEDTEDIVPEFTMDIHSLASSQENMGLFLPNNPVVLPPDNYSFDVAINDMNYEFQFAINTGESNRDVQSRLMRLINNSNIGIKASLAESEGRTSLRITSENSGLAAGKSLIFNISDEHTSKRSGTVDYFGLDYVSRAPSNARFLINGEERTARTNHFTVGSMFEIQLHDVSPEEEPVQIGLKTDIESLAENVSHLISGYNDFLRAVSSYLESQAGSERLVKEVRNIASYYGSSMESIGLNLSEDGTLTLDGSLLRQAAVRSKDIAETFSPLKAFSNSLLRKSNQVSLNPMDYVDKKIVAYKNPGHNFASPYITSAYSGMMFNSYC